MTSPGSALTGGLPDELLQVTRKPRAPRPVQGPPRRNLSDFATRAKPVPPYELRPARAFRANVPAIDLFPTALWAQTAARRLRRASANLLLGPLGYRPLQSAVAEYLGTSRGVKCVPEQIAIVSGVQEALGRRKASDHRHWPGSSGHGLESESLAAPGPCQGEAESLLA